MSCPVDTTKLQKWIENERIYDFLAGLDPELDQIRVQVLGKDPFPILRGAYAYVQSEELRRATMFEAIPQESSALHLSLHQVSSSIVSTRS